MPTESYTHKISETSGRLGPVRFCYPSVFAPKADNNGKDKYQVCVLIPKTDKTDVALFNELIEAAKQNGKNTKWGGKIPSNLNIPLRDGDEKEKEEFHGNWFFNCWTKSKPGVSIRDNGEIRTALEDEFYPGCWGAVTINLYPYSSTGNNGIGVGLRNIIKTQDDDRLSGGGSSIESDFGDLAI